MPSALFNLKKNLLAEEFFCAKLYFQESNDYALTYAEV